MGGFFVFQTSRSQTKKASFASHPDSISAITAILRKPLGTLWSSPKLYLSPSAVALPWGSCFLWLSGRYICTTRECVPCGMNTQVMWPVHRGRTQAGACGMLQLVLRSGSTCSCPMGWQVPSNSANTLVFSCMHISETGKYLGLQNSVLQLQLMNVKKPTLALNALQTAFEASAICTTGGTQSVSPKGHSW